MKNKIKYLPIGILTLTTAVSGVTVSSVSAATTASSTASVTVSTACAFSSQAETAISIMTPSGTSVNTEGQGSRNITVTCNSSNALKIQAVGIAPSSSSPSTPVEGNNALYSATDGSTISSNTPAAAGSNSYWAFKITSATTSTDATVTNPFSNYSIVPTSRTDAVTFSAAATPSATSNITLRTDYQVGISQTQTSGSYTGGVKYLIVDAS